MKLYFIFIVLTYLFWFASAHASKYADGSSWRFKMYLDCIAGFGHLLMLGALVYACFKSEHWWQPVIAYVVSIPLSILVPKRLDMEIIMSYIYPIILIITYLLIIFNV